nr:PfkB family carbohydrate kinase [uncultured Sphaerochaeta sp.]
MQYIIISTAVVDEIHFPGNSSVVEAGGGAGLYAYAGARLWHPSVGLCCGKGKDFNETLKPIFEKHNIPDSCMFNVHAETPKTIVNYQEDGERIETPVYGKDHYQRFVAGIDELEVPLSEAKGAYLFKEAEDSAFWKALFSLKKEYGFTLLWEMSASSAKPGSLGLVESIASQVEILSLNRSESHALYGEDEQAVIERLRGLGIPLVFYRRGKQGALMITKDEIVSVPSDFSYALVDPTGAGNSSSAAVLVGFCEGKTLYEIGIMGSIAAGSNISQFGIAPLSNQETFDKAEDRLAYFIHQEKGENQ